MQSGHASSSGGIYPEFRGGSREGALRSPQQKDVGPLKVTNLTPGPKKTELKESGFTHGQQISAHMQYSQRFHQHVTDSGRQHPHPPPDSHHQVSGTNNAETHASLHATTEDSGFKSQGRSQTGQISVTLRFSNEGQRQEKFLKESRLKGEEGALQQSPGSRDYSLSSSVAPRGVTGAVAANTFSFRDQCFSTCLKENTLSSRLEIRLAEKKFPDGFIYGLLRSELRPGDGSGHTTVPELSEKDNSHLHDHQRVHQKDNHPKSVPRQRLPPTDEDIQRLITEELEDYKRSLAAKTKSGFGTPVQGLEPTLSSQRDINATASTEHSASPTVSLSTDAEDGADGRAPYSEGNSSVDQIQISNVTSMSEDHSEHLWEVWRYEDGMNKAPVHSQNDFSIEPLAKCDNIQKNPKVCSSDQVPAVVPLKDPKYEDISDDESCPQRPQEPDCEHLGGDDSPQMLAPCESDGQAGEEMGNVWHDGVKDALSPGCDDGRQGSDDAESDDDFFVVLLSMSDLKFEPRDGDQNILVDVVSEGDCEARDSNGTASSPRPAVAAVSEPIEVFDTIVSFLESKAAVFSVDALSEMSPKIESCSPSEKSSDTDDSCDYESSLKQNHLTVSEQLLKKKRVPHTHPPKNALAPEKENDSDETRIVQSGQRRNSDNSSWTLKLKELIKAKEHTKHGKPKKRKQKTSRPQDIVIIGSDKEDDSDHIYRGGPELPRSRSSDSGLSDTPIQEGIKSNPATSRKDVSEESITIISDSDTVVTVDSMDESDDISPDKRYLGRISPISEENDHAQTAQSPKMQLSPSRLHDSLAEEAFPSRLSTGRENSGQPSKPVTATRHVHVKANRQRHPKDCALKNSDAASRRTPSPQLVSQRSVSGLHRSFQFIGESTDAEKSNLVAPSLIPRLYVNTPSVPHRRLKLVKASVVRGQDSLKPPAVMGGDPGVSVNRTPTDSSKPNRFSRQSSLPCAKELHSGNRSSTRSLSPSGEIVTKPSGSSRTIERHLSSSKQRHSHSYPASSRRLCTNTKDRTRNEPGKQSALERLKRDWNQSYFPTRRDKRHWTPTEEGAMSTDKEPKTTRQPSHHRDRTSPHRVASNQESPTSPQDRVHASPRTLRQRRNSKDSETVLMKRAKMEAVEWRKATIRSSARNKRSYVGEGYKWSEKTHGSRSREEFRRRDESPHRWSH